MKSRVLAALAAGSLLTVPLVAAPAHAAGASEHSKPSIDSVQSVAEGLVGPLKVAFGPEGSYFVAEAFGGILSSISTDGTRQVLVSAPGKEIAGVSHDRGNTYYFENLAGTDEDPQAEGPALVKAIDAQGSTRTLADLFEYEVAHDPDGQTLYGVRDAAPECLAQAPYLQTHGEVYSHPYSSVPAANGLYVGDAGGNALYHVAADGTVTLLKTLPAEPIKITEQVAALAGEMGLAVPECMMGLDYWAQPVPTDITVHKQWLYYTVLPGVPGEGLSMGKVYRMNLHSKVTQLVATGLNAPTGVAVDDRGRVFVAELFGGGVGAIRHSESMTVLPVPMASDVAIDGTRVAVTANALTPSGTLLSARIAR